MVATDNGPMADPSAEIAWLREALAKAEAQVANLEVALNAATAELLAVDEQRAEASARVVELLEQVGKLAEQVATDNDRIAELLAIAQRKKTSQRKKKDNIQPTSPPDLDDDTRRAFDDRPAPPELPGRMQDRPRPKQRPTGRKPLPKGMPVDESTVYPEACTCGCRDFEYVDEVIEEKLDIEAHQRRRRTVRKTGRCKNCRKRTTAEAPPSPFARSKATCEWLAWFIAQKFQLYVPLDRICRYLGTQGLALSKSYLVSQTERSADILEAIDGVHWKQLLAGPWMGTDGTHLKYMVGGLGLQHGLMEVYHRDDIVVFMFEHEKGAETQANKLAKYEGTLLIDAEARYNLTTDLPGINEANCVAHPRRKLEDAEAVQPILAAEAGQFVSAIFANEEEAKARELEGDDLVAFRQENTRPITEDFRAWSDAVLPTLLRSDLLAKVLRYFINHWTPLMRFLVDAVPLDNSKSERAFQAVAKRRVNSLFAGGTEGGHRAAIHLGIEATCKRLGVDFEVYLTWVYIRRGTHKHKYGLTAEQLTPAAYKLTIAD